VHDGENVFLMNHPECALIVDGNATLALTAGELPISIVSDRGQVAVANITVYSSRQEDITLGDITLEEVTSRRVSVQPYWTESSQKQVRGLRYTGDYQIPGYTFNRDDDRWGGEARPDSLVCAYPLFLIEMDTFDSFYKLDGGKTISDTYFPDKKKASDENGPTECESVYAKFEQDYKAMKETDPAQYGQYKNMMDCYIAWLQYAITYQENKDTPKFVGIPSKWFDDASLETDIATLKKKLLDFPEWCDPARQIWHKTPNGNQAVALHLAGHVCNEPSPAQMVENVHLTGSCFDINTGEKVPIETFKTNQCISRVYRTMAASDRVRSHIFYGDELVWNYGMGFICRDRAYIENVNSEFYKKSTNV